MHRSNPLEAHPAHIAGCREALRAPRTADEGGRIWAGIRWFFAIAALLTSSFASGSGLAPEDSAGAAESEPAPAAILIDRIRIVDGAGDHGVHQVLIRGDRIAAIDPAEVPPDARRYDGSGKTMLPGLIDSHVHVTMIPGEPFRDDSSEQRRQRHALDLRAYLAWGVTSIVDTGITAEDMRIVRDISAKSPAPEVYVIGPLVGPRHGYPSSVTKLEGIATPEGLRRALDEFDEFDPLGIKVTMENGVAGNIWPLFDAEMRQLIQSEAHERGSKLYIHAMDAQMTREALAMSPHALVHASRNGGQRLAQEVQESGAYVVSTLSVYGSMLLLWDRDLLLPNTRFTVPSDAIEMLYDKSIRAQTTEELVRTNLPGWPTWMLKPLFNPRSVKISLSQAQTSLAHLHQAAGKIVLGSDSGGWPMFTHMLHGHTTHVEINLLSQAGLSPQDIITAATRRPAEMLGLQDEIGSVRPGLRADLLIVAGDPLQDITALHEPVWVIRKGELRTPSAWMGEQVTEW